MDDRLFTRRRWSGGRRFGLALVIALSFFFLVAGWVALRPKLTDAYVSPMMRLHVVPNSDTAADQALKLSVRDALLPAVEQLLAYEGAEEDAVAWLASHADVLREAALAELRRLNSDYPVTIRTELNGDGEPIALRVLIGAGRGANWFCVLVPPLCFADLDAVEHIPADEEDPSERGGLRIAWKWLGKWLNDLGIPIEGVRDVDQDDVHTDLAHAVPGDGDIGPAAE